MSVTRLLFAASAASALLLGCAKKADEPAPAPAAAAPAASALKADASILDLMLDPIASNADALWNAVGTVSTPTGSKDLAPSTDAEWAALRAKAQGIIDAADLLTTPGRVVAHPDQKLKDPPGPGDLTPAQVQDAIAKDPAAFAGFVAALKGAAGGFIAAIDKHDVMAYETAGGTLDEVCESCHTRYWYPNAPKPPAP